MNKKWRILPPSKIIKYLGVPLAIDISPKEQWRWMMNKFEEKIQSWLSWGLPLVGKFTIVKKFLATRRIYYMSYLLPSQVSYK
jgi:hypothetical protein